jgi:hypothetical protein
MHSLDVLNRGETPLRGQRALHRHGTRDARSLLGLQCGCARKHAGSSDEH